MSTIFKIKLRPIIKESEWKVSYVKQSQKPKTCAVCGLKHAVGDMGTTFMKKSKVGTENKFKTYHTCGHKQSACTQEMAKRLNIELPLNS